MDDATFALPDTAFTLAHTLDDATFALPDTAFTLAYTLDDATFTLPDTTFTLAYTLDDATFALPDTLEDTAFTLLYWAVKHGWFFSNRLWLFFFNGWRNILFFRLRSRSGFLLLLTIELISVFVATTTS